MITTKRLIIEFIVRLPSGLYRHMVMRPMLNMPARRLGEFIEP